MAQEENSMRKMLRYLLSPKKSVFLNQKSLGHLSTTKDPFHPVQLPLALPVVVLDLLQRRSIPWMISQADSFQFFLKGIDISSST